VSLDEKKKKQRKDHAGTSSSATAAPMNSSSLASNSSSSDDVVEEKKEAEDKSTHKQAKVKSQKGALYKEANPSLTETERAASLQLAQDCLETLLERLKSRSR
jgi:hypothetical protein